MGHGPARELSSGPAGHKEIDPEDSRRLEEAFLKFEAGDPQFKSAREDEKHQQTSKAWTARTVDIVENLRAIGLAVVSAHQVLLDMGQDGAGVGIVPWIEEAGLKFDRLQFRLKGQEVIAESNGIQLAHADNMDAVTYEWLEKAIVEWLIHSANSKS